MVEFIAKPNQIPSPPDIPILYRSDIPWNYQPNWVTGQEVFAGKGGTMGGTNVRTNGTGTTGPLMNRMFPDWKLDR